MAKAGEVIADFTAGLKARSTPSSGERSEMTTKKLIALPLLLCSLACTSANKSSTKDVVTLCPIPIPSPFREAQFVAAYQFETTRNGKPINIRKLKNDFLSDEPFVACISGWSLPSISGEAVAEFFSKPTEGGWIEINISAKGFNKSFPYRQRAEPSR